MIFKFTGTIAYLIGLYGKGLDSFKVTVDSNAAQTVDLSKPNYPKMIFFTDETLENKAHTIKV